MNPVATFATIFFSMILVNNYVLVQFLGICPFLGVSKKLDSSAGMGMAVIVVMVIATAVTFPLQILLLDAFDLGYLQTIVFILVIAVLVQLIEITLKKYIPALYQSLGVYLPLITTNCWVSPFWPCRTTPLWSSSTASVLLMPRRSSALPVPVSASWLPCCCSAACASVSKTPTRRNALRVCPSRWCPPPLPR